MPSDLTSIPAVVSDHQVSTDTIYRWIRNGRLTAYKYGSHATLVSRAEVAALFDMAASA